MPLELITTAVSTRYAAGCDELRLFTIGFKRLCREGLVLHKRYQTTSFAITTSFVAHRVNRVDNTVEMAISLSKTVPRLVVVMRSFPY
jgi:hypothetical protein